MTNIDTYQSKQQPLKNFICLGMLLSCLYRGHQGLLLHQLFEAPFAAAKSDNLLWLYQASGIPDFFVGHYWAALFADTSWLLLFVVLIFKPNKKYLAYLACAVFINYFLIFKSLSLHHEHQLNGLLFCSFLLLMPNSKSFQILHEGLRFYTLFVMFSAFCWKLFRASLWIPDQMSTILKVQHLDYLTNYPDSLYSEYLIYLIIHPEISNLFWVAAWVLEAVFIVGFFTRKFDKWLALLFLAFFVMDYILMNLIFLEFCILILAFWSQPLNYSQKNLKQLNDIQ